MPKFMIEGQPWQRWPKKLVMHRYYDDGRDVIRYYVPEDKVHSASHAIKRCDECDAWFDVDRIESNIQAQYFKRNGPLFRPEYCPQCGKKLH